MPYEQHLRWFTPVVIGVLALIGDQITKLWIIQTLGPTPLMQSIPLVGDWFRFIYSYNTGVAFSMLQDFPEVLTVVALCITLGIMYAYVVHMPNRHLLVQISTGLIVGGALGNLIDRFRLGYVVDFIQVGWWPVFNVADSAICVGAALLVFELARIDTAQRQQKHVPAQ